LNLLSATSSFIEKTKKLCKCETLVPYYEQNLLAREWGGNRKLFERKFQGLACGFRSERHACRIQVFRSKRCSHIRGYGFFSNSQPSLLKVLDDVQLVYAKLVNMGVKEADMIAMGRSLGSLFAVEFASKFTNIAGLILDSKLALFSVKCSGGFASLDEFVLKRWKKSVERKGTSGGITEESIKEECSKYFSNSTKLQQYSSTSFLFSSDK
jgi:hypothetical protein